MRTKNYKLLLSFLAVFMLLSLPAKGQVTIGSDKEPNIGALLDLKQYASSNKETSKKGLNLPRVALENLLKLEPCAVTNTTNKSIHEGLVVYNITDNSTLGLSSGFYYWNGASWVKMITEVPASTLNLRDLQSNTVTIIGDTDGSGGTNMSMGTITIPEDGSYAFSFRLYGGISNIPVGGSRCAYYISVWADGVLKDIAEINIIMLQNTVITYSITLGGTFTTGQNVIFKISHNKGHVYPWSLTAKPGNNANRTSMIWWKL